MDTHGKFLDGKKNVTVLLEETKRLKVSLRDQQEELYLQSNQLGILIENSFGQFFQFVVTQPPTKK